MSKQNPIKIVDDNYILREALVDSSGDIVWEITDPKTKHSFVVHSSTSGKIYINFFKGHEITPSCSYNSLKKLCEILLKRNLTPTINIHYTNTGLIALCTKIGFRKLKNVKHQYYLKSLK